MLSTNQHITRRYDPFPKASITSLVPTNQTGFVGCSRVGWYDQRFKSFRRVHTLGLYTCRAISMNMLMYSGQTCPRSYSRRTWLKSWGDFPIYKRSVSPICMQTVKQSCCGHAWCLDNKPSCDIGLLIRFEKLYVSPFCVNNKCVTGTMRVSCWFSIFSSLAYLISSGILLADCTDFEKLTNLLSSTIFAVEQVE